MKIDVFPHILPRKYFDRLLAVAPPGLALTVVARTGHDTFCTLEFRGVIRAA